jgi:hypothetical protein
VRTLEEITYEAGRSALADQESLVAGIRQRTGTLLAAHALVGVVPWCHRGAGPRAAHLGLVGGALGVLMVVQTLAWLAALAVH